MPVDFYSESLGHYRLTKQLSVEDCCRIANNPKASRIIFDEPLNSDDLVVLEEWVFSKRSDITLIFYTFNSPDTSLAFLSKLPSVRKLITTIPEPANLEALGKLEQLEDLRITAYGIEDFDFLTRINPGLKELHLYSTFSGKPTLKHIGRFELLETLTIEGHTKYIEEISKLKKLQKITVRSVSAKNIDFLKELANLWYVDIKLGGIVDFSALETIPNLKYLELWKIRLLKDISFIARLSSLQYLFLQDLPHIEQLPALTGLTALRRIELVHLKGLTKLDSIVTAPVLSEFIFRNAKKQSPEQVRSLLERPTLKTVYCDFDSIPKNEQFEKILQEYGRQNFYTGDFQFV